MVKLHLSSLPRLALSSTLRAKHQMSVDVKQEINRSLGLVAHVGDRVQMDNTDCLKGLGTEPHKHNILFKYPIIF